MEIKKITKEAVKQAIHILKTGGVVVYPTDTLYGLGADAQNKKAVQKVYDIKGRDFKKPISVLVSEFSMAEKLAIFNTETKEIFYKIFPGPFTLILPKKKKFVFYGTRDNIGIRVPADNRALSLVREMGGPITSTSANIAGEKTAQSAKVIYNNFKNREYKPDLILDAGRIYSSPSTVIDLSAEKAKILRKGSEKNLKKLQNELR